ncbi:PREDICTED: chaperone protein dnaJ 11, chloroplastic-like [Ipomoea nil]|uniref:chaperone protein dnaJ 11, chloroplastic-like n=1 Tax=Ipomoea nil TaxID=35883 RepID=UPI000901BEA2|nr:PREDICTED: chaperone protein dnaJ 11, chloroplastic-like [Ipomoea nil]
MASASIPFCSQFSGTGVSSARSRRSGVAFRQPISTVSASCATAERTSSGAATHASLYEVLGIQTGATCQEIKAAYRRLARVLHPDVASSFRRESSDEDFIRVHAAYVTLSDPQKRANYDRTLFRPGQSRPPVVFSGVNSRRNWETDQCW